MKHVSYGYNPNDNIIIIELLMILYLYFLFYVQQLKITCCAVPKGSRQMAHGFSPSRRFCATSSHAVHASLDSFGAGLGTFTKINSLIKD